MFRQAAASDTTSPQCPAFPASPCLTVAARCPPYYITTRLTTSKLALAAVCNAQACPHVSGLAARCYASGECDSETDTEAEAITSFAKEWNVANSNYGFTGDAISNPNNSQYYGYAVYAGRW